MWRDPLSGDEFQQLVDQLSAPAAWTERHLRGGKSLRHPSGEETAELLDKLRALLFPGYFGNPVLGGSILPHRAGTLLDEIAGRLQDLIESCLAFDVERTPESGARAEGLVAEFIRGLPEIQRTLHEDVVAAFEGDPACTSVDEAILSYPGLQAITLHRLAHRLSNLGVPLLPRMISEQAHSATGIDIHPGAEIGAGIFIDHGTGVVIGETCIIGRRVKIYQGVTLGARSFPCDEAGNPIKAIPRHPIVEDGVVIYSGATILGRITLGRGSVIGGNVWLTRSLPPDSRVFLKPVLDDSYNGGAGI